MAYNSSDVMDSETAFKILKEIHENEEGSYPSKISEEIDAHQSTISDIIKQFRDMEILERGKRTKAQYYKLDLDNLVDFFWSEWGKMIEETPDWIESDDLIIDFRRRALAFFPEKEKFNPFLKTYFDSYISFSKDPTLRDMIFSDFAFGSNLCSIEIMEKGLEDNPELEADFAKFFNSFSAIYLLYNRPQALSFSNTFNDYMEERD